MYYLKKYELQLIVRNRNKQGTQSNYSTNNVI